MSGISSVASYYAIMSISATVTVTITVTLTKENRFWSGERVSAADAGNGVGKWTV